MPLRIVNCFIKSKNIGTGYWVFGISFLQLHGLYTSNEFISVSRGSDIGKIKLLSEIFVNKFRFSPEKSQTGSPKSKTCLLNSTHMHARVSTHAHTQATILWLSGLSGKTWVSRYQKKNIHPLTPIVVISQRLSASSIYYDPWHPPCSIYVLYSLFTISVQVFFGLPLGLAPSTSYSIHFFTESLSLFHPILVSTAASASPSTLNVSSRQQNLSINS